MKDKGIVIFHPDEKQIEVKKGETIRNAAIAAGVDINSICGGVGECGKCKVIIKNPIPYDKSNLLTEEEIKEGYRLACKTYVWGNVEVYIPESSRAGRGQILTRSEEATVEKITPFVRKFFLELSPPTLNDNLSDLERIQRALKNQNILEIDLSLSILKNLSTILREGYWKVTVTIANVKDRNEIVGIEKGDTSERDFGLAIDIGTTTVVAYLIDLKTGKVLDMKSNYNKQIMCGEDVIARMNYADELGGLKKLSQLIVDTINYLINELCIRNIKKEEISCAVVAGNTTMMHLFLGLDPKYIKLEPYIPTANLLPYIKAEYLGLHMNSEGYIYCIPGRSSYVGGDITADILTSNLHKADKLSILIDVGTNGEVVLGNKDWLMACSCSAGPAFEGGEVSFGMRATTGAIEKVDLNENLDVQYSVIGNVNPKGICGSGLIDLIAELFAHGVIDKAGKIMSIKHQRIRDGAEGKEFVVCWAKETVIEKDIVITEVDIKNIIRTKAAVYAACSVLLKSTNYTLNDVDRIYIAGGFGNYLDAEKAILLGLLPDVHLNKFKFIGNGAVAGARLVLLSREKQKEVEEIFKKMTYLELSVSNTFMNEFTSALFLPHTDIDLFPTVKELVNK